MEDDRDESASIGCMGKFAMFFRHTSKVSINNTSTVDASSPSTKKRGYKRNRGTNNIITDRKNSISKNNSKSESSLIDLKKQLEARMIEGSATEATGPHTKADILDNIVFSQSTNRRNDSADSDDTKLLSGVTATGDTGDKASRSDKAINNATRGTTIIPPTPYGNIPIIYNVCNTKTVGGEKEKNIEIRDDDYDSSEEVLLRKRVSISRSDKDFADEMNDSVPPLRRPRQMRTYGSASGTPIPIRPDIAELIRTLDPDALRINQLISDDKANTGGGVEGWDTQTVGISVQGLDIHCNNKSSGGVNPITKSRPAGTSLFERRVPTGERLSLYIGGKTDLGNGHRKKKEVSRLISIRPAHSAVITVSIARTPNPYNSETTTNSDVSLSIASYMEDDIKLSNILLKGYIYVYFQCIHFIHLTKLHTQLTKYNLCLSQRETYDFQAFPHIGRQAICLCVLS